MTLILANVIFPAFTAPYLSPLMFPVASIAALATEYLCYRRFSPQPKRPSLRDIIVANVLSWFVGIAISLVLPSGLVPTALPGGGETIGQGPHFNTYVAIAFVVAGALSIVIEGWYLGWSAARARQPILGIYRLSAIANVASYIVLGVLAWLWLMFPGWSILTALM